MTKEIIYRYLGTNGVLETPIHIEGTYYTRSVKLQAGPHKILTNGKLFLRSVKVPEEQVEDWTEIEETRANEID